MNREFVYFVTHTDGATMRVGYATNLRQRLRDHAAYGFKGTTAIVPGSEDNEASTHASLRAYLADGYDGTSVYRLAGPLVEYLEALLGLGRAAPTIEEASMWPRLGFDLWRFGSPHLEFLDQDGQPSLWRAAPIRERLKYAHKMAILQSTSDEWYTPVDLVDRARCVLGWFDLDPASSPIANRTIRARAFYTKAMNGLNLALPWSGKVWLNPPYGRGIESAGAFVDRLMQEIAAGSVTEAITCLNLNAMSSEWFRPLHDAAAAHVLCYGRPSYVPPSDKTESSATKGTVLSYIGPGVESFAAAFSDIGAVYQRYMRPSLSQTVA